MRVHNNVVLIALPFRTWRELRFNILKANIKLGTHMPIVYVVKRDGRKEEFAYEKIVVSCMKAGAPLDVARKIAKIVEAKLLESGVSEVSAKELTKMVLELLKKENEEWYRNWIIFDRAVKRRRIEEELKEIKP